MVIIGGLCSEKKNKTTRTYILILVVGLAIGLGVGALLFGGNSDKEDTQNDKGEDKVTGTLEEMIQEDGYTLGYLNLDKGNPIEVKIISYDVEFGEKWTTEEEDDIYGMLDDINYILGMLLKKANFEVVS